MTLCSCLPPISTIVDSMHITDFCITRRAYSLAVMLGRCPAVFHAKQIVSFEFVKTACSLVVDSAHICPLRACRPKGFSDRLRFAFDHYEICCGRVYIVYSWG